MQERLFSKLHFCCKNPTFEIYRWSGSAEHLPVVHKNFEGKKLIIFKNKTLFRCLTELQIFSVQ